MSQKLFIIFFAAIFCLINFTAALCNPPPDGHSGIYIYGKVIPEFDVQHLNKSCQCDHGKTYFFQTKLTKNVNLLLITEQFDILTMCQNLCLCDINQNCYIYKNHDERNSIYLFSYCDEGKNECHMRLFNQGTDLKNVITGEIMFQRNQFTLQELQKPLNDPAFLKINKISCNGCNFIQDC